MAHSNERRMSISKKTELRVANARETKKSHRAKRICGRRRARERRRRPESVERPFPPSRRLTHAVLLPKRADDQRLPRVGGPFVFLI
jgi:hypothetical protein